MDGAENNPPSLYTTRQYEVSASYSLNEHTFIPDILIVSVDTWRRLSPDEQGAVFVITSYSIHYTKLYDGRGAKGARAHARARRRHPGGACRFPA